MAVPTIAYSNDIYVNQVGDDVTISITQDGNEIFTLSENNTDFPINDL